MLCVNPCFEFLDRAVIAGRADEIVCLPDLTFARLLEDVAAVGGVLRSVGVQPDSEVAVELSDDVRAVTALLATLRLGAVPSETADVKVLDRDGEAHLVWPGEGGEEVALDWAGVLKAGRTDPAPAHETPAGHRAARPDLSDVQLPATAADLRATVSGV